MLITTAKQIITPENTNKEQGILGILFYHMQYHYIEIYYMKIMSNIYAFVSLDSVYLLPKTKYQLVQIITI